MCFVISSCKDGLPISWTPNFYVMSHSDRAIINEIGHTVEFEDPAVNEFACLHFTKVQELAAILERARLPKDLPAKKNLKWVLSH